MTEPEWDISSYKGHPTYRECARCGEIATLGFGKSKQTALNPEGVKFWLCEECADNYVASEKEKTSNKIHPTYK